MEEKKILIVSDHYPLSARVKKVRDSLLKIYPEATVKILAWNRESVVVTEPYVKTINHKIGYGNRLKKFLNLFSFMKSVKKYYNKFNPDYIHTIDFEMLVVGSLLKKNAQLVYEVYDIKSFNNKLLNWIREKNEFFIIKHRVDGLIFASPYFNKYYKNNKKKMITLNNKPNNKLVLNNYTKYMMKYNQLSNNDIVIGFIGTVRYKDVLLNLINSVKNKKNIKILIAGSGPDYEDINEYIENNHMEDKVIMTGRYEQNDLATIYSCCDYIWAAYPNRGLNEKYAISNKFFESIVFNKRVIVSEKTEIGDRVSELGLGYTVDPFDIQEIKLLIDKLEKTEDKFETKKNNFRDFWESEEFMLKDIYN